jgi:C-terminal processing protease CtpA/Prc
MPPKLIHELKRSSTESERGWYELGTEIELMLSKAQAARLECGDNPYGLKEYLICPTSEFEGQDILFIYCVLDDGQISGGGSALPRLAGALRQVGQTPCMTVASWTAEDDTVTVRFQVETDRAKIREEYAEWLKDGMGKISLQVKDSEALWGSEGAPTLQLTPHERIVGFVRLWSEVKYNFAFFDQVPDLDWDKVLEEYLPRVEQDQTAEEYYQVLQECIALLHDGHTGVWPHSGQKVGSPALRIQPVEGRAVIVEVGTSEELIQAALEAGDEITHVDGRPVREVLEQDFYPYLSASTPQQRDRAAYGDLLEGPRDSKVSIRIRSVDGSTRDVTLTRHSEWDEKPWTDRPLFEWRELSDGIVYVALNSFGSEEIVEEFDEIFEKVQSAKGLIFDVRENGGGSTGNGTSIISYLIDKPLKGSHWKTRKYIPAFRAWGREEQWYESDHGTIQPRKGPRYLGPVVVLTGPGTASAAEDFVVALHAGERATLVGERTAGTTGQPLMIDLPGGGARICTKRDTYPDGREFVGIGVIPHVEVHPTRQGIVAGRDPAVERGIEVLKELATLEDSAG